MVHTMEIHICPECNGTLATRGWETYCTHCGLVVDEYVDTVRPKSKEDEALGYGPKLTWLDPQSGTSSRIGNRKEYNAWKRRKRRYPHSYE